MQSQTLALSRAIPLPRADGLDFGRIGAFSAVIAIHLIAAGLLLAPMRIPDPGRIEQPVPITIVLPQTPPPPLVPIKETRPPTVAPDPVVKQRIDPLPPSHVESASNDGAPPIASSTASTSAIEVASGGGTTEGTAEPKVEPAIVRGSRLDYASNPAPAYPRAALIAGFEGTVVLEVTVDENGKPIAVAIATSSGSRELDRAARDQVLRAWRFQPAMQNGHAVRAIGMVPVNFTLDR